MPPDLQARPPSRLGKYTLNMEIRGVSTSWTVNGFGLSRCEENYEQLRGTRPAVDYEFLHASAPPSTTASVSRWPPLHLRHYDLA